MSTQRRALKTAVREWEAGYRPIALKVQAQARRGRESFFLPPNEFAITLQTIFLRIAGNSVTTLLLRLFIGVRSPKYEPSLSSGRASAPVPGHRR